MIQLINGSAFEIPLVDESVHCVVTSPPYYGLRQYQGIGEWIGGDAGCDHKTEVKPRTGRPRNGLTGGLEYMESQEPTFKDHCPKCGATRNAPYGLEPTLDEYIANTVAWAREVRRVLRSDGTLWLNLGDSYATGTTAGRPEYSRTGIVGANRPEAQNSVGRVGTPDGLKTKDLMGVPWRVALALQSDGWYLRSDIIWSKPNPMPESVTDRPTKSHEYLFLLSKSARYFYDADAVRESAEWNRWGEQTIGKDYRGIKPIDMDTLEERRSTGRNRRTVWEIATAPYSGAHFATYPPALVEPCIKAGTSERGVCPECAAPWKRVVEKETIPTQRIHDGNYDASSGFGKSGWLPGKQYVTTTGWHPTCEHDDLDPIPATVLDPFVGSGTTLVVARQLGRSGIGIDASWPYLSVNARERLGMTALEQYVNGKPGETALDGLPLFDNGIVEQLEKIPKQDQLGKRTYTGFNERWKEKHG